MEFWAKLKEASLFIPIWTSLFLCLRPILLYIFKFFISKQIQSQYERAILKKQNLQKSIRSKTKLDYDDNLMNTSDAATTTTPSSTFRCHAKNKLPLKYLEKQDKCVEQFYLFFYHTLSFTMGMLLLRQTQYWKIVEVFSPTLNLKNAVDGLFPILWTGYPHKHVLDETFTYRMFYSATAGIWVHHLIVLLNLMIPEMLKERQAKASGSQNSTATMSVTSMLLKEEQKNQASSSSSLMKQNIAKKKRNEQYRLLLHHVVTVFLVIASFSMNFIRGGHILMMMMDVSDILLSLAKALKYLGKDKMVNSVFACFAFSWLYTRVYAFGILFMSIIFHPPFIFHEHQLDPFGNPANYFGVHAWIFFMILLGLLYGVTLFWTVLIWKVLERTLEQKGNVDDVRSDSE